MSDNNKIKCTICGSTSVFKLKTGEYKCNYCQNSFVPGASGPGVPPDLYSSGDQLKVEAYVPPPKKATTVSYDNSKKNKPKLVLFVALIAGLFAALGAVVFLVDSSPKQIKPRPEITVVKTDPAWGKPSINRYIAFAASKQPVIWEILEYTKTGLDSSRHDLRILNAETGDVLINSVMGEPTTWKENFNYYKKINYEYLLVNDTLYNGSEDGGLQVFDVYTGRKLFGNDFFENKYPQLKKGIAKTESHIYNKSFLFTTNDGDEFVYYPFKHLLRGKDEEKTAYRTDTMTRQNFYFSEGKKCFMYLTIKQESGNESAILSEFYIDAYEKKDKFYLKHFKKLQKLSDKVYPCAQRILSDENSVVFAYMSDFSSKAHPVIEKMDATGKTIWQNTDTALVSFVENFSGTHLYLNFSLNKQDLLLFGSGKGYKTVALDLNSGKTKFVHRQGYNID